MGSLRVSQFPLFHSYDVKILLLIMIFSALRSNTKRVPNKRQRPKRKTITLDFSVLRVRRQPPQEKGELHWG